MKICAKCGEILKKKNYALVQRDHDIPVKKLPKLSLFMKSKKIIKTSKKMVKTVKMVKTNKDKLYVQTEPNRPVFYFAATYCDFTKSINKYPKAYGKYENSGYTVSDSKGRAVFDIKCPQVYERADKTYPRHIHYMITDAARTKWLPKIYTTTLICDVDKSAVQKYLKTRRVLVIDALPKEYYEREHIPGAINMYHITARRKSNNDIKRDILKKLPAYLKKKSVISAIKKIPIIVYCYSKDCGAARDLVIRLYKAGFHNVLHYAGGIMDWKRGK
jgi:rhodanese-related sulfurtransferase